MLMMRGSRWLDDWLSATYVPADARDVRVYGHTSQLMFMMRVSRWLDHWPRAAYT